MILIYILVIITEGLKYKDSKTEDVDDVVFFLYRAEKI